MVDVDGDVDGAVDVVLVLSDGTAVGGGGRGVLAEDVLNEVNAALMVRLVKEERDNSIEETVFNWRTSRTIRIPAPQMKDRSDDDDDDDGILCFNLLPSAFCLLLCLRVKKMITGASPNRCSKQIDRSLEIERSVGFANDPRTYRFEKMLSTFWRQFAFSLWQPANSK